MTQEQNPNLKTEQMTTREELEGLSAIATEGFLEYVDLAQAVGEEAPEWLDNAVADLAQEVAITQDFAEAQRRGEEMLDYLDKNIDRLGAELQQTTPNN